MPAFLDNQGKMLRKKIWRIQKVYEIVLRDPGFPLQVESSGNGDLNRALKCHNML